MKRTILAIFLVFVCASTGLADSFQFRTTTGVLAVEAAVYLDGRLVGYTDAQGIIIISSPKGAKTFSVRYRDKVTKVTLCITGNPQLQMITIP
jgi:hypothetical protein